MTQRRLTVGEVRIRIGRWLGLVALISVHSLSFAGLVPQVVARGFEHPWALAFLDQGRWLVSERPGRLRIVQADGRVGPPLAGLPPIEAGGQGGLLDVVTDSDFARNRRLYLCYAEPAAVGNGNSTALASAVLSADGTRLQDWQVLFRQLPKVSSRHHFGCRIVEDPQGHLYLTLGDRFSRQDDAQTLDNHHGKVVRLHKDGRVPADNPLRGQAGALPEIWSWGHRNPQGATWGPDQRLWLHEHGPQGGDEVNAVLPGRNYGWPVITYGERYGGGPVGSGQTHQAGMEQPLWHWTPSIAPSGMAWLTSERYGADWQGSLFVGALRGQHLVRLVWQDGRLREAEKLLGAQGRRIRDVRQGPDGWLYVLTDERNAELWRLQRVR
jgi:aldose sugar dehydrogenase